MTWLAATCVLTGAALSRWCRVLVLVPLAIGMIVICTGAALGGLLTVTTAIFCAFVEMSAMQFGFLAGLAIEHRVRRKKRLAPV